MPTARSIISIGTFDGVHAGHAAIVARACALASSRPDRPAVTVLAFDPHPATVLRPGAAPGRLTTWAQRRVLLETAGADRVVRLEPTPELLGLEADEFVTRLVADYAPAALVEGPDFRFGAGRRGDLDLLRRRGAAASFAVHEVAPVEVALSDHTVVRASSTLARWLISMGRVTDAQRLLGRPYAVEGVVVRGARRGRELGFPTANVSTECLVPGDGVYAGSARLGDGRTYAAAVSVGGNETFPGAARTLEAHLLDAPAGAGSGCIDGLSEYGWRLELRFTAYLRDQARFGTVGELVAQIGRDCARARELITVEPPGVLETIA
ncbi:MAG TPA: bifunctional riboflavin kinase/FMN adenylyltransferase [Phycisphaerales bacterium]|nr:bifunctional riboflavin kinase/FMN adenylyltransferase [Phycisphaerales bacterium]